MSHEPPPLEAFVFPDMPPRGRLLAIDYGDKRMGFAVSDPEQSMACPVENYTRRTPALDQARFKYWIQEYCAAGLVVGLPIFMNGSESPKSQQCRQFAIWLHQTFQLPVTLHDERCTSAVVEDRLVELDLSRAQRKKRLDMLAAQVLLQSYLDGRRPPRGTGPEASLMENDH